MREPNGTLAHSDEHGWIWTTECCKCGTVQRICLAHGSLAEVERLAAVVDTVPRECPGGFHTELAGWRRRWSLDLLIERYSLVCDERALATSQSHGPGADVQ